jgi:hypothetical protein
MIQRLLVALLAAGLACSSSARAADAPHERAFWLALKRHDFKLPPGASAGELSRELPGLIASTDPELRDGVGYEACVAWVYRDMLLTPAELESLRRALVSAAREGLGEGLGDGIFRRSFALLDLSVLAATDLKRPFLSPEQFEELLTLALEALSRERDLRGYVAGKGWAHATAHGADLVKFLARSPHLTGADGARVVEGIAVRLRTAQQVFTWGEDARLAAALLSLARRPAFEAAPFDTWLARLAREQSALWQGPLDVAQYVAVRAQLNTLDHLAADLMLADGESPPGLRKSLQGLLSGIN